jgi:hypothetical protein
MKRLSINRLIKAASSYSHAQAACQTVGGSQFTLPYNKNMPAESAQLSTDLLIPFHVLLKFALPETRTRFRRVCKPAPWMTMPEAAVHEDDCSVTCQHNIRTTRKVTPVETKAEAKPVQERTNGSLGDCVPVTDAGHIPASVIC